MKTRLPRLWRGIPVAVAAMVLAAGVMPAAASVPGARPGAPAARPAPGRTPAAAASRARPGADEVVAGVGDTTGYRIFQAGSGSAWTWRQLARLAPGGATGEPWTGRQCLTGDGSTVVAVVAPWHTTNSAAGRDRGAVAYAIDARTGRARVLATGVAEYYFNPGCGAGNQATLTRYLGSDQKVTQVLRVSAVTGKVLETETTASEITSAVPVSNSILGADGAELVRLSGNRPARLAAIPAGGLQLRPNSVHGVDLLASAGTRTSAWRWAPGSLTRLSKPTTAPLALLVSRGGQTTLAGPATAARAAGVSSLPHASGTAESASANGDVLAVPAGGPAARTRVMLPALISTTGRVLRRAQAPPGAGAATTTTDKPADPAAGLAAGAATARRNAATRSAAVVSPSGTPACAVPRDDVRIQVPQPSNTQVNWAIQQAVVNALPARTNFDNLGSYSPQASDFSQPALLGATSSGDHVPELVVDAIMAQESNWDQASWHAASGLSSDPLVADYYGNAGNNASPVDYGQADCGYGLGQITDGMHASDGSLSPAEQQRVAVDYAENTAATVNILATTWDQLYGTGITINGSDPEWLENWYATVWAYNSGIHPDDGNGNSGLGWSNNPVNPVYPQTRGRFLLDSGGYTDASTPSNWPYQELVFGWMNVSLERNGFAAYAAVDPSTHVIGLPDISAMCTSADHCNSGVCSRALYGTTNCAPSTTDGTGPCTDPQYHCWWHWPITTIRAATPADMSETAGQAEPSVTNPEPPTCGVDAGQVPGLITSPVSATVIVDEEAGLPQNTNDTDMNLAGCPADPMQNPSQTTWAMNGGTLSLSNVWDSSGNPLSGQVDLHQLGAGFGGHMFFDHMVPPSDTADRVTATWTPNLPGSGVYDISVFVPDIGATATDAMYTVNTNYTHPGFTFPDSPSMKTSYTVQPTSSYTVIVNQGSTSGWVNIGSYYLAAGGASPPDVTLTNTDPAGSGADLGINAVAFTRLTSDAAGKSWVAMGDSYSSGEGTKYFDPTTDDEGKDSSGVVGVNMCHRSPLTYSALAFQNSSYAGGYAMAACSGAVTDNIRGPVNADIVNAGQWTEPPQAAALSDTTSLVTLTIGGNDVGFEPVVQDCIAEYLVGYLAQLEGDGNGPNDCLGDPATSPLDSAITSEKEILHADYQWIHSQAPNARIVVLIYPRLFPETTTAVPSSGCNFFTYNDILFLQNEQAYFGQQIQAAAQEASNDGVPVSVLDESAASSGHDLCSDPTWFEEIDPSNGPQAAQELANSSWAGSSVLQNLYHPTQALYQQEATDLHNYLVSHGWN